MSANVRHSDRERERGQIIVIFALALVAIIAMVGLVLDGGSAFAQRRDRAERSRPGRPGGRQRLHAQLRHGAARRSCPDRRRGERVHRTARTASSSTSRITTTNGAEVTGRHQRAAPQQLRRDRRDADLARSPRPRRHRPAIPDTANGAGADHLQHRRIRIRRASRWRPTGTRPPLRLRRDQRRHPGERGRHRLDRTTGPGNVDSDDVRDIIDGHQLVITKTIAFGEYIGQHNNGNHTTLFGDINDNLAGTNVPVPVVDHNGNFQGWATFHVVSADGRHQQAHQGYFVKDFQADPDRRRLLRGDLSALFRDVRPQAHQLTPCGARRTVGLRATRPTPHRAVWSDPSAPSER